MNMKQIFDKFLSDNGIYKAYRVNAKGLQVKDPYLYISDAFIWDHTTEGFSFWLDINYRWRKIVLAEEAKSQIEKKQPKQKEEDCSFCNGKSKMESTSGDNWGTIRLLKSKSILDVALEGCCDECDESISFYSVFNIKYCPMCGEQLSND